MADKINPNSFFNQTGDTAATALSLAQRSFNLSETIKEQLNILVKNVESFKLEFNEYNTENTTNITKIFNDYSTLSGEVDDLRNDIDAVSKVFFDFQGVQEKEKKEAAIQSEREAEAERDKAWEDRDKQQKTREEPKASGTGGDGTPTPAELGDGPTNTEGKKKGFFGGLMHMLGAPMRGLGALGSFATLGTGMALKGVGGGFVDWLTGGRTDWDGKGDGKLTNENQIKLRTVDSLKKFGFDNTKNQLVLQDDGTYKVTSLTDVGDLSESEGKKKGKQGWFKSKETTVTVPKLEDSTKISDSGEATLKNGQVVSGDMSQEDAEKTSKLLSLESELMDAEIGYGHNSPEANRIKKEIMILKGTPEEAIYTDKKGNVKSKGYSTFEGKNKDSISLESSKSAVVEQGQVVSGDMSQAKADYSNKKLELVKYRQQLITRHGRDSDEVKEIDSKISALTNNYTNMIQSSEGTTEKGLKSEGTGDGFKRAAGGFADFMTGGMFDFDKKNRKGAPKDFGIRRIAGGIADSMTMGLTDFDKRGKGNLQFDPISGGKDKAWGSANEQAKRREKQSGMGIKRGIGGALDFATLGMFDFDKQNRRGAPKGWGIKRVAGGLADAITAGATDFDKRGTGIGQMKLGEMMSDKKRNQKIKEAMENSSFFDKKEQLSINPLDRKNLVYGNLNDGKPMSRRELHALAESGDKEAIKIVEGIKSIQSKMPEGGHYNWQKQTTLSDSEGSTTFKQSYSSGDDQINQILEPPTENNNQVINATSSGSIQKGSQEMFKTSGDGGFDETPPSDNEFTSVKGTYCPIGCINDAKSNSTFQLMF